MRFIKQVYRECRESDSNFFITMFQIMYFLVLGKRILCHHNTLIKGGSNISTNGVLRIGMNYVGFANKFDKSYFNIRGSLIFHSSFAIGKGCRFDIGNKAVAEFGSGYINPFCTFIIMNGLKVGEGSIISWGCQFLDDDFHKIEFENRKIRDPQIEIGDRVWIGSNVNILKGVKIPNGCVIASGSVVSSVFLEENCLIGGNPAKIVKRNVRWS